ncbi:MAG TPA: sigma-70 family RNA polymerase sigma factor, partial [Kofleriaceae bacterium]|nr:sigma-70 family RNA polymerase sigma factor [Kofleriaceae bacterium]
MAKAKVGRRRADTASDATEASQSSEEDLAQEAFEADAGPRKTRDFGGDQTYLSMYFRDMAQLGILRPEAELASAQEIEALEIALWHVLLGFSPATSLLRDEFVRANLRLVVTMARRYDRGGMPLADLIQEGNLGLMHAVARFDYRRGLRFSTYACWWIRHAIGRALADKARAVRIPVHMLEAQQQLEKVRQSLVAELGRPPTPQELAKAARLPLAKLNQMHRYIMGSP